MKIEREKLEKYAEEKEIRLIVLFGSRVAGTDRDDSDFDVAVLLRKGKGFSGDFDLYSNLLGGLSKIFDIGTEKLDLTDLAKANILLRHEIVSGGSLLFGDEDDYAQYRAFAFRDYIDAKPLFELEDLLIRKRQLLIKQAINK